MIGASASHSARGHRAASGDTYMGAPPLCGAMVPSTLPVVALVAPRSDAGAGTPSGGRLWRAYVDGGAHPNPGGTMGIGVVVLDPDGNVVSEVSFRPKQLGTNNEAEYLAVLRAITEAQAHGADNLEVCADSKLTVNTLSGRWRVKAPNLVPIKRTIDQAAKGLSSVRYRWIPREQNKHADRLATEAIGGTVGGASKYGKDKAKGTGGKAGGAPGAGGKAAPERPKAEGILCGACKQVCTLEWQVFSNGQTALRQTCPTHGYLRFAPKEHPFTEVAGPEPRAGARR